MKKILGLFAGLFFLATANAQIVASGHAGSSLTAYTNGSANDSIYFYCTGELGTLSAEVTTGTAPYDYQWYIFVPASNNYTLVATETDVLSSTISDLQPGGYKLSVVDANGEYVACDRAWVAEILTNPSVNVNDIAEGCGSFQLGGQVTYGTATPYYNLPPDDMIIDVDTEITVCFTGTHTWVSDLAFYVVGPTSCGSPTILLSPNPGAIGQGTVCNSGDNITNLCFTTEPAANLNVCSPAPATLTGTYSSYGPANTPINWAPLYGCSANASGWKVQIYDCIGGDIGTLTDATISFEDVDLCGQPLVISYTTPPGFASAITDNSCTAGTASVFNVPTSTTTALTYSNGFIWTASPTMTISNATTLLNPLVNPTQNTVFTLTITGNGPKAWCGGNITDSEERILAVPEMPAINPVNSFYCLFDAPFQLTATPAGGTWSGTGVNTSGMFNPATAGVGNKTITYTVNLGGCIVTTTIVITIWPTANTAITDPSQICLDGTTVDLSATPAGGVWTGSGIIDEVNGIFDPSVVGVGEFDITYTVPNQCLNTDNTTVVVSQAPEVNLTNPGDLCIETAAFDLIADYPNGTWSGAGVIDPITGTFDPTTSGLGTAVVSYTVDEGCPTTVEMEFEITSIVDATIVDISPLCESSTPVQMAAATAGGSWSGPGVSTNGLFDPSQAGAGDITLTYTISGTCSGEDNTVVNVEAIPTFSFLNDGSFCAGGANEMLTTTLPGGVWSGTGITNAATGMFSPATSGVGSFTVTYAVDGLCPASQTQTITVHALPNVNAGADTEICAGGSTTLSASGATDYQWTATGFTNNNQNASVQPNVTTTYTVTGTDSFGCQDTDNVVVTVNPLPVVTASTAGAVCEGECATLTATGLASYSWTPAATLTGANTSSPTACPGSTTTYTVSGVDANGCSGSAQVTQVVTQINVSISASPTEGFAPLDVNFFVSSNADDFDWTFGNGITWNTNSTTETPSIFYDSEGFYTVTVTANLDGCSETDEMEIIVYNFSTIKIPNIVTTNNDGLNDAYRVQGNWIEDFNMQIYNRFGDLVGELKDVDEVAPNGFDYDDSYDTWNPSENSDGTYFFHYKAVGYDGKVYENTGSITVLSVK